MPTRNSYLIVVTIAVASFFLGESEAQEGSIEKDLSDFGNFSFLAEYCHQRIKLAPVSSAEIRQLPNGELIAELSMFGGIVRIYVLFVLSAEAWIQANKHRLGRTKRRFSRFHRTQDYLAQPPNFGAQRPGHRVQDSRARGRVKARYPFPSPSTSKIQ